MRGSVSQPGPNRPLSKVTQYETCPGRGNASTSVIRIEAAWQNLVSFYS
jgi:hypothetical protein